MEKGGQTGQTGRTGADASRDAGAHARSDALGRKKQLDDRRRGDEFLELYGWGHSRKHTRALPHTEGIYYCLSTLAAAPSRQTG